MNKSDLEKMQKCEEEYEKFLKESPLHSEMERIAEDIIKIRNIDMAMEFTKTISELLRENGIVVHCQEYQHTEDISEKSIKTDYGVIFDSVDCTEHDKKFKDEIRELKNHICELESKLSVKENLLKIKNGLCREKPYGVHYDLGEGRAIGFGGFEREEAEPLFNFIKNNIDCKNESQKENDRLKTTINQIDDILNKLFGVTHDIVKTPDEFEKILRDKADNYKNISDFMPKEPIKAADLIIENFKQGLFPIYERDSKGNIKHMDIDGEKYPIMTGGYESREEVRQIAEHLLVYCNHNLKDSKYE